jgi:hypothetical protein
LGDGILQAIVAGYEKIYSIELADKYYKYCSEKYEKLKCVTILQGDSPEVLKTLLPEINEPCVFWLDGHHSCGDTGYGKKWSPLMDEIESISQHHIKTHTILIDDMRCWKIDNPEFRFGDAEIRAAILKINSDYKFTYEDGCEPNDILVAKI